MTNKLSPAAQAVLDAYETSYTESGLVAALRAVANQDETLFDVEDEMVPAIRAVRTDRLLAIAAALEALPE